MYLSTIEDFEVRILLTNQVGLGFVAMSSRQSCPGDQSRVSKREISRQTHIIMIFLNISCDDNVPTILCLARSHCTEREREFNHC